MNVAKILCVGLICFFTPSCFWGNNYICSNKEINRTILFSWDTQGIYRNHVRFRFKGIQIEIDKLEASYGLKKGSAYYRDELKPEHQSGDYNISNTKKEIKLSYMEDIQFMRIQKPSGRFIKNTYENMFKEINSLGYAITYTATMPTITTNTFDKERQSLLVESQRLNAVRRPTENRPWIKSPYKEKHWVEKGAKYTSVKNLGQLTEAEIEEAFFQKNGFAFLFPNCEKNHFGKLSHWIEALTFH